MQPKPKHAGGRKRTGTLEFKNGSWHARLTVTVDGEPIRKWFDLSTDNKAVARRKLARLNADQSTHSTVADVASVLAKVETYAELSERVATRRREDGIRDADSEEGRERLWVLPEIGHLAITAVKAEHIIAIYERVRVAGKSISHLRNLRTVLRSRFNVALEEEIIGSSPVDRVRMPKVKLDRRERAVLTDVELAVYLGWMHPREHHQLAVRERQTMSAIARMFGGVRTGDLHAMKWTGFDLPSRDGQLGFTWGVAPRKKTARPQRITVPESLRPILADWWQRQGRSTTGLVFPSLRGSNAGIGEKQGVSHAAAMRRDLQAAFVDYRTKNASLGSTILDEVVPAKDSPRWAELFEEGDETRPVDFHSWRRKFCQALSDMGMTAQQAQKLAGHADLSAHERYLRTSAKTLDIPVEALPDLSSGVLPLGLPELAAPVIQSIDFPGAPDRSRTCDLRFRKASFYHESLVNKHFGDSNDLDKPDENIESSEVRGRTSSPFVSREMQAKAADSALASYLKSLAESIVESMGVAA